MYVLKPPWLDNYIFIILMTCHTNKDFFFPTQKKSSSTLQRRELEEKISWNDYFTG